MKPHQQWPVEPDQRRSRRARHRWPAERDGQRLAEPVHEWPAEPTHQWPAEPTHEQWPAETYERWPAEPTHQWPAEAYEQWPAEPRHAWPETAPTTVTAPPPPPGAPAPPQPGHPASTTIWPTERVTRVGRRRQYLTWGLFWCGVVAVVAPWWLNTPGGSVTGADAAMVEAGRLAGLLGGYVLLLQFVLMSRVGWLERRLTATGMVGWHRDLGAILLFLVLSHLALITAGYAGFEDASLLAQTGALITGFEDMRSAYVAAALLVAMGLLAVRTLRRRLPRELWYVLHLLSYAVLLLSYGHAFANGQELAGGWGRWIWVGLYAVVLAVLVWGRVVTPLVLNLRHRFRVADVVPEGPDTFSVYIAGWRLDRLPARAGHFFRWRFLTRDCWWQAHPFSLSAAPNPQWLRLTIKAVGGHTRRLGQLRPGVRVIADGPSGAFTADQRTRPRALLIAGGSGIAPIRALLEELPPGAVVLYRASGPEELIFQQELDWLAQQRDAQVWYVLGSRDDPAPRQALSPRGLRALVPDVARRDVYLCGPPGLVAVAQRTLRRLRVPRRQVHVDPFEF